MGHASVDIWVASTTSTVSPGGGSNHNSAGDQGVSSVTGAHANALDIVSADLGLVDVVTVDDRVAGTAVYVGQRGLGHPLQAVGEVAGIGDLAPAADHSRCGPFHVLGGHGNGTNVGVQVDLVEHLEQGDVVVHGGGEVRVVHDAREFVLVAALGQGVGAHNDDSVGDGASVGAMGSGHNPFGGVNPAAAQVVALEVTHGDLVGELALGRGLSAENAALGRGEGGGDNREQH